MLLRGFGACVAVSCLNALPAAGLLIAAEPVPLSSVAAFSAVADLNRDAQADLVLVERLESELKVFLGNAISPSQLETGTTLRFGGRLRQPASGDLDGDGDADLAVADDEARGVWILLGTGDGNFSSPYFLAVGRSPFAVAIADFDGVRHNDLAVADAKGNRIFVRLNDGQVPPQFPDGSDYEIGDKPTAVVAADFSRDGHPDIAALNTGGPAGNVGVLIFERLAAGFPVFAPVRKYLAVANPLKTLLSADFDNDGVADVALLDKKASNTNAEIALLLGREDGIFVSRSFEVGCPFFTGGVFCEAFGLAVGRFGGNGSADFAVLLDDPRSYASGDALQVFVSRGAGGVAAGKVVAVGAKPTAIAAGDFNGDGLSDVAVAARLPLSVRVFRHEPTSGSSPHGAECTLGDECLSGRCTNARCCATQCFDFERCDVPGMEGVCIPVVNSLGCTADLDCPGVCRVEPTRECADHGDCAPGDTCNARVCRDGFCCDSSCSPTEDRCDAPGFEGVCVPKADLGAQCGADADCATGFCRDGFCCDGDCADGACDVFGAEGRCRSDAPLGADCGDALGMDNDAQCASEICDDFDFVCCDAVCTPDQRCSDSGSCVSSVPTCGDGTVEGGETCDNGGVCLGQEATACGGDQDCPDGQACIEGACFRRCTSAAGCPSGACAPVGGDGCAANCTHEDVRSTRLDAQSSPLRIQTIYTTIDLSQEGVLLFRTGQPRAEAVIDPEGAVLTEPGELPVAIRASDWSFEPLAIPGLLCACTRAVPQPASLGPNVAGTGKIGCGPEGLSGIDYRLVRDHNTDPGDPNNGTTAGLVIPQLADDEQCDDSFTFPTGLVSSACRELSDDPRCDDATAYIHIGVCNSPSVLELAGQGPSGSSLIHATVQVDLLADTGACRTDRPMVNDRCLFLDYGDDCLPCTEDDVHRGMPENLTLTTGTAQAAVYDAGNYRPPGNQFPGRIDAGSGEPCGSDEECPAGEKCRRTCEASGFPCTGDVDCPGDFCRSARCEVLCGDLTRCLTEQGGAPFDCSALLDDPEFGLSTGALAAASPDVDPVRIGDNVTASLLAFERGDPIPTPTATPPVTPCAGDCDRSGFVLTDDLVKGVGVALGQAPVTDCSALDADENLVISVTELVAAVRSAMLGCDG